MGESIVPWTADLTVDLISQNDTQRCAAHSCDLREPGACMEHDGTLAGYSYVMEYGRKKGDETARNDLDEIFIFWFSTSEQVRIMHLVLAAPGFV